MLTFDLELCQAASFLRPEDSVPEPELRTRKGILATVRSCIVLVGVMRDLGIVHRKQWPVPGKLSIAEAVMRDLEVHF